MAVTLHDLFSDARQVSVTLTKPTATSATITWVPPNVPLAYAGAVVLLSEAPLATTEIPVNGIRYIASTAWGSPGSPNGTIGSAQVVASFNTYFGDTLATTVTVTGLEADKIYYASVHIASNILQYHQTGVKSYPVINDLQESSISYAGSIPKSSEPPTDPVNGQAYYDLEEGAVLVWNDARATWIKSNKYPVVTNGQPKIDTAAIFFSRGEGKVYFFNGTAWVEATSSNLRTKQFDASLAPAPPYSWHAFTEAAVLGVYPEILDNTLTATDLAGRIIDLRIGKEVSAPEQEYLKVFAGDLGWQNASPEIVQVDITGLGGWTAIKPISYDSWIGNSLPPIPEFGDFFYNSQTKQLLTWANGTWTRADTAEQGLNMVDKVGVGTDGTDAVREQLSTVLKAQLGYPQVCVELDTTHFEFAIDRALSMFRRLADNATTSAFVPFSLIGSPTGGQDKYYLNDPRDNTDKIVSIIKVHRINMLGISSLTSEGGLYAQAFFNQLWQGQNVDVISIHLMSQLSETYEKIFAGNIMFNWNEAKRELTLFRKVMQHERVLFEVTLERTEQDLIEDRYAKTWIHDWAKSEAIWILGQIRSKYTSGLASATGGLTLNGEILMQQSLDLQTELKRQINDYEVGNGGVDHGNCAFVMG